jgi:hypothetical protein
VAGLVTGVEGLTLLSGRLSLFLSNSGLVGRLSFILPGMLLLFLSGVLSGRVMLPLSIVLPGRLLSALPSLFLSIALSGRPSLFLSTRMVLPGMFGLSELFRSLLSRPLLVIALAERVGRNADSCGRYILT